MVNRVKTIEICSEDIHRRVAVIRNEKFAYKSEMARETAAFSRRERRCTHLWQCEERRRERKSNVCILDRR